MPLHPNTRRCNHLKVDGSRCGSPALTGKPKCHFHIHIFRRTKEFVLPPLEDANAIQVGVMEVMRALLEDRLERAKAGTLLYALQIAQSNLKSITLVAPEESEQGEREPSLAEILFRELRGESAETDAEIDAILRPRPASAEQDQKEEQSSMPSTG